MDTTFNDTSIPVGYVDEEDPFAYTPPTVDQLPENKEIFKEFEDDEPSDNVIRVSDIQIEGAPYERNNPYMAQDKPIKEVTYGTTQVAATLGISAQTVRNYLRDYNDFLNVDVVGAGSMVRAHFTKEDIENLRNLIKVKDENNFTTEQMREYMANPDNIGYMPESRQIDKSLQLMLEAVKKVLEENTGRYLNMIESQDTQYSKSIESLNQQIAEQNEQIKQMKEAMDHQNEQIKELSTQTSVAQKRELDLVNLRNEDVVSGLKHNISSLNEDIEQNIRKITLLESENSSLSNNLKKSEEDAETVTAQNKALEKENAALRQTLEDLQSKLNKKKKFLGFF